MGIGSTIAAVAASTAATSALMLSGAASSSAAPFDPQVPSVGAGWCPGGGSASFYLGSFCDGIAYEDGTRWHYDLAPGFMKLWCVTGDNKIFPEVAQPGGCGGSWQG
jgi:hypothetical protein